jgi:hypothetical protein
VFSCRLGFSVVLAHYFGCYVCCGCYCDCCSEDVGLLLFSEAPWEKMFWCVDGEWLVVEEVLIWNVGNFRREHFMAEVEKAGCGYNPGTI